MNDKRTRPLQLDEPIVTGNTKAAVKAAGGKSADLWMVPYEQIHYDPRDNVRPLDVAWAKHLGKLIAADGYDKSQPLHCYIRKEDGHDRIYVWKGQHRYHGIGCAISEGVDVGLIPLVIIDAKSVNRVNMIFGGLTSNDSKRTSPLELAEKIAELRDVHGIDSKTICQRLNITDQTVRDVALLETAPAELHKLVRDGVVAGTLAIDEIRKHGAEKALERLVRGAADAKAAGKARVTKKHLAKPSNVPALRKITDPQAKQLLQALQAVLHDNGFAKLSPGTMEAVHISLAPLVDLLDPKPIAKPWPVTSPDENGCCDALDVLDGPEGGRQNHNKPLAQIRTAQPKAGVWIHAVSYHLGTSFASGPLKIYRTTQASWTRVQAIRAGAAELIAMLSKDRNYSKAEQAAGEKVMEWARKLFNQPDPDWTDEMARAAAENRTPDLTLLLAEMEGRTTRRRPAKGLHPATAWPFPTGGQP